MTSREMFENAHVEKFGVWYAGIHFVDGKYCPSTASIPLKVSEEVTARYEMFTAGFHSRDELLREAEKFIGELIELEPEYHSQGMGCGLEDRDITDRYDAMAHGWEKCVERYAELIENPDLIAKLQTALKEAME